MLRLRFVYIGKARDLKQALDALRRRRNSYVHDG